MTLVAFLAWVGLGADGLSSSAYGPDEAFRALGSHAYLAVILALMIAATVLIISACYSKVIELFPGGGGGYLVATKLLGRRFGVISGCALIVDYVLTISTSVASGVDQIFSFLPPAWHPYEFLSKLVILGLLVLLNLRGIKESVQILVPIFLLFIATHFTMIVAAVVQRFFALPEVFIGAIQEARTTAADDRARPDAPHHPARLFPRRRRLHGHRGRLERHPDHPGAQGPQRETDDDLHGSVARLHGGRHHARLPADRLAARSRTRS